MLKIIISALVALASVVTKVLPATVGAGSAVAMSTAEGGLVQDVSDPVQVAVAIAVGLATQFVTSHALATKQPNA